MSMSERDQAMIERLKQQERADRAAAFEASQLPKGPATTNDLIVRSAVAICLVIAASAYFLSAGAFWKPQTLDEVYCYRNGGIFWFFHRTDC